MYDVHCTIYILRRICHTSLYNVRTVYAVHVYNVRTVYAVHVYNVSTVYDDVRWMMVLSGWYRQRNPWVRVINAKVGRVGAWITSARISGGVTGAAR